MVFYSYAHEDRGHLTQLRGAMGEEHSDFDGLEFWADEAIPAAAEWRRTIETKLRSAVCAIVPVSRHLLASEFVMQVELPMLEALGCHVASTDEMTGIQALERAAPTKPMRPGCPERREHAEHLARLTPEESAAFFGPLTCILAESADPRVMTRYARSSDGVVTATPIELSLQNA